RFQCLQRLLPTIFVHPVSSLQKDITATTVEISTVVAVFTNNFCPISLFLFSGTKTAAIAAVFI
ncbi:MAG: hypothetical protein IJJ16_00650, partial [Mogibacterium sp.]|nr:hypothetical protein [Mogibacterium sp.]